MPAMLDLPDLPVSVEITLQIALIALSALAGFLVVRPASGSAPHLLERRREETGTGTLPQAELERRVRTIGTLVVRVAGAVISIIAVLMALDLFGIDIGPAVAGLGVVGIAIGFGAQTLVRDWLAGIFIVLENQYSAGDMVRLVGVEGVVEDFSLRRTTLRDLDGSLHVVPNGQIIVASKWPSCGHRSARHRRASGTISSRERVVARCASSSRPTRSGDPPLAPRRLAHRGLEWPRRVRPRWRRRSEDGGGRLRAHRRRSIARDRGPRP